MNFEPRYLVATTPTGEYRIELRSHGDWSAQWAGPQNMTNIFGGRTLVSIDDRDDAGAKDWPSMEQARAACMHHQRLMATMGPQEAADAVAAMFYAELKAERAIEAQNAGEGP